MPSNCNEGVFSFFKVLAKYNTGILTEKELYSTENTDLEIIRNDDSYCYIVQKTYNLRPKTKK